MKQNLLTIKRTTKVTTKDIAERAKLSISDVFTVEAGGFSSQEIAQRVINAFNQLSGLNIIIDDIVMRKSEIDRNVGVPLQNDVSRGRNNDVRAIIGRNIHR